jgi:histidinol phosphatase-like enzyme
MRAASELDFDPSTVVVVGDKESDIEFGRRVGAPTVLISNDPTNATMGAFPDFIAPDLPQAAEFIQNNTAKCN